MALSKLEPDQERAEELVHEMKRILDATMIRDPKLNTKEHEQVKAMRQELEAMGLTITIKYNLVLDPSNPFQFKVDTVVNLFIPRNLTIQ